MKSPEVKNTNCRPVRNIENWTKHRKAQPWLLIEPNRTKTCSAVALFPGATRWPVIIATSIMSDYFIPLKCHFILSFHCGSLFWAPCLTDKTGMADIGEPISVFSWFKWSKPCSVTGCLVIRIVKHQLCVLLFTKDLDIYVTNVTDLFCFMCKCE